MIINEVRKNHANQFGVEVPFNIIVQRHYNADELAENQERSQKILAAGGDAWEKYCDDVRRSIEVKADKLLSELEKRFSIGQLHDKGEKYPNYDLWFWCRYGDHSYFTLNYLKHYNGAKTEAIIKDVNRIQSLYKATREFIEAYEEPNLCATIMFHMVELPEEIKHAADEKALSLDGKWVRYGSDIGKFWIGNDGEYCFRKKYAKKLYFILEPSAVMRCEVA